MRQARLKAPPNVDKAYYHVLSRVVDKQFLLGEVEKEQFVGFMREYERFCGVRVITYCIMSNHFHILLEVPHRPEQVPGDEELLARLRGLSGLTGAATLEQRLGWFRERGEHDAAEALREGILGRMWDVSGFMKLLKQRFTQWYNRAHERAGTLWESRFKSVLVEGAGKTLATMAAYIDLNPVRAKLVEEAQEYRWCGYGAALGGVAEAVAGLGVVIGGLIGKPVQGQECLTLYRRWLYAEGEERGIQEDGKPVRAGMKAEAVAEVVKAKGKLPLREYLRLRVRYFTDGAVLGSREFVNGLFVALRDRFGPKRKDGARRMRYLEEELFSLRDLQVRVVAAPGEGRGR